MINLQNLKLKIFKYKIVLAVVFLSLFGSSVLGLFLNSQGNKQIETPQEEVLGAAASPTPTPSPTPAPTPSPSPRPRVVASPSPQPAVLSSNTQASPTPSPSSSSSSLQSSSDPTPTPSPTPSPAAQTVEIHIDYAGASEKPADTYTPTFTQGQTAWDVIKSAVGEGNITYTQYSFGVFITGFYGVQATGNQFWEFKVNGQGASVGVSDYVCNNGDDLEFVISTF